MENNLKVFQVTSIDKLKEYSEGSIVKLPSFGDGQDFYAKLKRPSLMALIGNGKIPNELLSVANSLFDGGAPAVLDKKDDGVMKDMFEVVESICEASFVEPSYKELKDAGVNLTDEQLLFVFGYSQVGVRQLEKFRN